MAHALNAPAPNARADRADEAMRRRKAAAQVNGESGGAIMEEQETMREVTRRLQDAARKGQERGRETSDEAIGMAGVATDTLGVWLQANQQVLHNLMELSTSVAQQTIRLLADVQQANLQAMQEMQANRLRWLCAWPEAFRDPAHCESGDRVQICDREVSLQFGGAAFGTLGPVVVHGQQDRQQRDTDNGDASGQSSAAGEQQAEDYRLDERRGDGRWCPDHDQFSFR